MVSFTFLSLAILTRGDVKICGLVVLNLLNVFNAFYSKLEVVIIGRGDFCVNTVNNHMA